MNAIELLDIIKGGESSKVQFKREFDNQEKIAAEMIAMSNAKGGMIIFGVEDKTGHNFGFGLCCLAKYLESNRYDCQRFGKAPSLHYNGNFNH